MIRTVQDLLEALEGLDPDTPVRLAMQQSYPMNGRIENVCVQRNDADERTVWIACSGHLGYGCPEGAWEESVVECN